MILRSGLKNKDLISLLSKFFLLVFIFFSFFMLFYNVGRPTLDNWDEAWYGEMTKEMLRTKDYVVLRWNRDILFDKPPMYIWLSALTSSVIGLSEFSIRLPSALSGLIIVILVTIYSYKKWGFVSSVIAFSSIALNNIFIWRARSGNTDIFAALLIFISFLLMISKGRNRNLFLGIVFACIYLTKASLVFYPLIIFIIHEVFFRQKEIKAKLIEYLKLFFIFIVIISIWLFLGYIQIGYTFISYYLFHSDQRVANISILNFKSDYISYTYYSLQRRYFYLFILGLFLLIRKIKNSVNFLILVFVLSLLLLLSFTERNNNWYLIPSMPFWALTIGYSVYKIIHFFGKLRPLLNITIIATGLLISYRTYSINIFPIINTYSTTDQAASAAVINRLSQDEDIVVRLDHLYPATIYYSGRRVLASPLEAETKTYWISRSDLVDAVKKKKIKWIVGKNSDIDSFLKENETLSWNEININKTEKILQVKD